MNTYEIVDATVQLNGVTIVKQNIIYYENGNYANKECYSINGEIITEIQKGYVPKN